MSVVINKTKFKILGKIKNDTLFLVMFSLTRFLSQTLSIIGDYLMTLLSTTIMGLIEALQIIYEAITEEIKELKMIKTGEVKATTSNEKWTMRLDE